LPVRFLQRLVEGQTVVYVLYEHEIRQLL